MFSALNGPKWHQQANSRLTTPSLRNACSGAERPQQANSCVTKRQIKHVCIDAQECGRVADIAGMVNVVGANVGANF